jgi:hypothetical protein
MTTFSIYSYLFVVTALYAVLLARFRHLWEPHLTWLEVVIGTVLVLMAPYLDARSNGPLTWELYEARVWQAFLVGGAPIIIWQLGRSVNAWRRVERRIRGRDGNTADRTAPLAAERGPRAPRDD